MLLVRTHIGPSKIHGIGLFVSEPIAAGTIVWRFTAPFDLDLDPSLLAGQPAEFLRILLHYGYVDRQLNRYVLCCDDARFINHSKSPTLVSIPADEPHGVDVAARDIADGEELTLDYEAIAGMDL
jgi:SET domain-containing protein